MFFKASTKNILFSSGLSRQEYKLIEDRVCKDNAEKLTSGTLIVFAAVCFMYVMSFFVESIALSRSVYLFGMLIVLFLFLMSLLGHKYPAIAVTGAYIFTDFALIFGIYQGTVTAPAEQASSYMALVLAIPFWFGLIPYKMILSIFLFTGIFVVRTLAVKTGYAQVSDIVNSIVYTAASALISTYATCGKCRRFYAEYLTEQAGKTDALTSLGNRFAFTEHINEYKDGGYRENFTVWYFDVNELKFNNDTFGHQVGDELLRGAADCIISTFADVGTCYRTGGDEFIVITETDRATRDALSQHFEKNVSKWHGSSGKPLRISYGCASQYELPDKDIHSVIALADSRLYDAKDKYYRTEGVGRHGHEPAAQKLSDSCIVIIKIDLTNNMFRRFRNDIPDELDPHHFVEGFTSCVEDIVASDRIHPDDREHYRDKMQLDHLREHFRSGKRSLHIFYRRKFENSYYPAMTELITANEYTDEQQILYLYVKIINE